MVGFDLGIGWKIANFIDNPLSRFDATASIGDECFRSKECPYNADCLYNTTAFISQCTRKSVIMESCVGLEGCRPLLDADTRAFS